MIVYLLSKLIKKARLASILDSEIGRGSKVEAGSSFVNSLMMRHSFCGYDCSIINAEIGSFCSIANNVKIGGVAHPMHFVSTSPVFLSHKDSVGAKFARHDFLPAVKTIVGHDVWIGEGAFIKAGICVGTGAVVGMGAVVTRDVPPYAIVAGNPAQVIRKRFSEEMIESLLLTEWWSMGESELHVFGRYMNDPEVFIRKISHR